LAQLLVDTFYRYRSSEKFYLHEFVIMPDHLHAIITPHEITLERAIQLIKGGYSHAVGQTGRKALEIWQRGYTDHRVRDFSDYEQHRIYIHQNPVRKKLCEHAAEYRWSSAFPGFELDEVPQRLKPLALSTD
jgi:putative transposase